MSSGVFRCWAAAAAAAISASGLAIDLTFQPSDLYLSDLDHYYAYQWGVDITIPTGHRIKSAQIRVKNIFDWTEEDDTLYVTMMNEAPSGVQSFWDDQGAGDYFQGRGVRVGTWTDPQGGYARDFDLVFDLGAAGLIGQMNTWAKDGKIAFGFDPDCHYFNDGVYLTIQTEPVPEPASICLIGAAALGWPLRRRLMKR